MSASVRRRIERNIREREDGHRSPRGRGRYRGLNPVERAAAEQAWSKHLSAAKAQSVERQRQRDEHSRGVR